MDKSIYESLNQEQQKSISDFMKDFILSQISNQIDFFIKENVSSAGAKEFIFEKDNKFQKNIKEIGFPEDWEHKEFLLSHQQGAVDDIEMYFDKGWLKESKKLDSRCLVYSMDELRCWFELDLKEIYPSRIFVKILTDNGLEYKESDIQSMWDGVLFFAKKHKQLINPTTGSLF